MKDMYKGKLIYTTLTKEYKTNGKDIHLEGEDQ